MATRSLPLLYYHKRTRSVGSKSLNHPRGRRPYNRVCWPVNQRHLRPRRRHGWPDKRPRPIRCDVDCTLVELHQVVIAVNLATMHQARCVEALPP